MPSKANTSAQVTSPPGKANVDANQNVFEITVEVDDEKNNPEPAIIDTEDNWIAKFLYGGPIGYTVNFSLLIAATAYLVFSLRQMINDEESYRTIIKRYWLPTLIQFFTIIIPTDLMVCAFAVLIIFPLSRLSRSTVYYWFLGLSFSMLLLAAIWPLKEYLNLGTRGLLIIEWGRMSMKIAAFLVECSWSEQVFNKSSMKSLLYFLWIPTLVYKHQYPIARRIRWVKVFCHLWWIFGPGLAVLLVVYEQVPFFQIDLLTVDFGKLIYVLSLGLTIGAVFYPSVAWLFIFENFCGFHGELLRYPYLKSFGNFAEIRKDPLTGTNTIASKWFSRYIYIPIVKSGGTRVKAMWATMAFSLPVHELGYLYVGDILIIYSFILGVTFVPFFLALQPKSKVAQILMLLLALPIFLSWIASYALELLAWNYSSLPDVDKLSRIRLVPLFYTLLYQNFNGPSE